MPQLCRAMYRPRLGRYKNAIYRSKQIDISTVVVTAVWRGTARHGPPRPALPREAKKKKNQPKRLTSAQVIHRAQITPKAVYVGIQKPPWASPRYKSMVMQSIMVSNQPSGDLVRKWKLWHAARWCTDMLSALFKSCLRENFRDELDGDQRKRGDLSKHFVTFCFQININLLA